MPITIKLLAGVAALTLTAGLFWSGYVLWLEREVLTSNSMVRILAPAATLVFVTLAAVRHREWINRRP